jgi:hypothetical protein
MATSTDAAVTTSPSEPPLPAPAAPFKRGLFVVVESADESLLLPVARELNVRRRSVGSPLSFRVSVNLQSDSPSREHVEFARNKYLIASERLLNLVPLIEHRLNEGITVVFFGYAFIDIARGVAAGLNLPWCESIQVGLPKPDVAIYLNNSAGSKEINNLTGWYRAVILGHGVNNFTFDISEGNFAEKIEETIARFSDWCDLRWPVAPLFDWYVEQSKQTAYIEEKNRRSKEGHSGPMIMEATAATSVDTKE